MIDTGELRLAMGCAASSAGLANSPRSDLQGVLFDFLPDNIVHLVGSNGQRITMVTLAIEHTFPGTRIFIPLLREYGDIIAALPESGPVTISVWDGQLILSHDSGAHVATGQLIEYPDYLSIFEARQPPAPAGVFNIRYLRDLYASCHELTDDLVYIEMHDNQAAYFRPKLREDLKYITDVRVAIMPCGVSNAR